MDVQEKLSELTEENRKLKQAIAKSKEGQFNFFEDYNFNNLLKLQQFVKMIAEDTPTADRYDRENADAEDIFILSMEDFMLDLDIFIENILYK